MQNPTVSSAFKAHLEQLKRAWGSTIVARTDFKTFSGGAYSAGHMANQDSQGNGPNGAFRMGKKTMYPVESAIKWLADRSGALNPPCENLNKS